LPNSDCKVVFTDKISMIIEIIYEFITKQYSQLLKNPWPEKTTDATRMCRDKTADATRMCRNKTTVATRTKYHLGTQFVCAGAMAYVENILCKL
jgi:hypothetical protein